MKMIANWYLWDVSHLQWEWSRILLLRYWVTGSAEKANWGILCCLEEKGRCFELGRMFSFPTLARVIGCWSDCKLHESRNYVLCISVWLIVSSTKLANIWNGQYSINIKWLGWSFFFLLPTWGWDSRIRNLVVFSGLFLGPRSNLQSLLSLLVVRQLKLMNLSCYWHQLSVPQGNNVCSYICRHLGFQ